MKMLTAAAALEAGVVTLDEKVNDSVSLTFGPDSVRNFDDRSEMGRIRSGTSSPTRATSRRRASPGGSTGARRARRAALRHVATTWASGSPPASTWPARRPGSRPIRARRPGRPSTSPTARSARASRSPRSSWPSPTRPWSTAGSRAAALPGGGRRRSASRSAPVPRAASLDWRADLRGPPGARHAARVPGTREGSLIRRVHGRRQDRHRADLATRSRRPGQANDVQLLVRRLRRRRRPEAVVAVRIQEAGRACSRHGDLQLNITSYELFRRVAQVTVSDLEIPPLPTAPPADDIEPGGRGDRTRRPRPLDRPDDPARGPAARMRCDGGRRS